MIMKTIQATILFFFIVFSSSILAQTQKRVHKEEPSRNIRKHNGLTKLNQLYFEKTTVLKTYFKSGEIAKDFPGYNYALPIEDNKKNIETWLANGKNKKLLTKEGYQAITTYINKK